LYIYSQLTGKWTETIYIEDVEKAHPVRCFCLLFIKSTFDKTSSFLKNKRSNLSKWILLDLRKESFFPKIVPPIDEQEVLESRRLWDKVTKAIMNRNLDLAAYEKTLVEGQEKGESKQASLNTSEPVTIKTPKEPKYFVKNQTIWHYVFG
jgi:vancomycin resistance protein YoaR